MIHVFHSRIPNSTGTHLRGQAPTSHPLFAVVEAAVRNPDNYRHVATCTQGAPQGVLEALQEGGGMLRQLGVRPLIPGDLLVDDIVWIVAQDGIQELTGVTVEAYKYRNVPTFSLVDEEPAAQLLPVT